MQRKVPVEPAPASAPRDQPEALEPGLWRIPVPLPFALRSANIYLLDDGAGGWTLVDAGLGLPADEAALRAGLELAGIGMERITALILTHAHPDHIGLAGPIVAASGAPVYMLAGEDERMFRVWEGDGASAFQPVAAMYAANGLAAEEVASARTGSARTRGLLRLPPRDAVRTVADGETLTLGAYTYTAIWTPGHSDYHLCLLRDDRLFIAGDHILPSITPNIGWYPQARPNPLGDYFQALARVRDLDVRLVLPGHRLPFVELARRVDELRTHHEERGDEVLRVLDARPNGAHAMDVARVLFGGRLRTEDDRRFGLVEALAHLEYLRLEGHAAREEHDGLVWYARAGAAPTARPA